MFVQRSVAYIAAEVRCAKLKSAALVAAVLVTFFIGNISIEQFLAYIPSAGSAKEAAGWRSLFFFYALLILLSCSAKPLWGFLRRAISWRVLAQSALVLGGLLALCDRLVLFSQGTGYGLISLAPFQQERGYLYRRLLVPALSYYLQFQGPLLYNVFTFLITFALILVLILWLRDTHGIRLNVLQWIALLTSGCVIFQFQFPGYCEQMVFLLCVLSLVLPLDMHGRVSVLAMILLTHEGSAFFVGLPVVLMFWERREIPLHLLLYALYGFFWFMNYDFSIGTLMSSHLTVSDVSAWDYFIKQPGFYDRTLVGLFLGQKFLWIFFFFGLARCLMHRDYRTFAAIAVPVLFSFGVLPGMDVSKFMGWGYLGVLMAVVVSHRTMPPILFNLVLLLNFLMPSFYMGTNTGIIWAPGLYLRWGEWVNRMCGVPWM